MDYIPFVVEDKKMQVLVFISKKNLMSLKTAKFVANLVQQAKANQYSVL